MSIKAGDEESQVSSRLVMVYSKQCWWSGIYTVEGLRKECSGRIVRNPLRNAPLVGFEDINLLLDTEAPLHLLSRLEVF